MRTIRSQSDGRFVVETARGALLARDVIVATNGYTDGVAPDLRRRVIPIGSYIIATEVLPEDLARSISPKRSDVLRHEALPLLLAADARSTAPVRGSGELRADVGRPDGTDPAPGDARGASAARRCAGRVRLGRERRVHVRSAAPRREDVERGLLCDGLLRFGRRDAELPRRASRRVGRGRSPARDHPDPVSGRPRPVGGAAVAPADRRRVVSPPRPAGTTRRGSQDEPTSRRTASRWSMSSGVAR